MRQATAISQHPQREAIEVLADGIAGLFERCPELSGFSVQDAATLTRDRATRRLGGALCIADVTAHGWRALEHSPALREAVAQTVAGLLEERPEAYELLRGRTFARTFHWVAR